MIVVVGVLFAALLQVQCYEVSLDTFSPYPDSDRTLIDYGTLRISKKSRNHFVVSGNFTVLRNIGQESRASFEFTRFDARGRQFPVMKGDQPFCEFYNTDYEMLTELREVSNWPEKGSCPFPKKQYYVKGYEANVERLPPFIIPGMYVMKFMVAENGKVVGGYTMQSTIK